jgi:hypothetical protein
MALKTLLIGCTMVTVEANVPADLAGKEHYIVEQVAGSKKVQLYTNGIPYAVLYERLQGSGDWSAVLISAGGICPCIAGGAIDTPAFVKPQNGGKVIAAASGNLACGTKRKPETAAADTHLISVDLGLVTMP